MNYQTLRLNLEKYGRDKLYAYVCASFKPELRQCKKYQQWQRLLTRATLKAMTPKERHILNTLLELKALSLVLNHANEPNTLIAA